MAKVTLEQSAIETPASGTLVKLKLDQITLDEHTNVRGKEAKDEAAKIDMLAKSIYEQGQLQPIVVRPNGNEGHFLLIAGRRRFAACKVIQAQVSQIDKNAAPIQIDAVVVNKTDDEAYLAAITENLQRRQFSPIELANTIQDVKKRLQLTGEDWTKHVADFLKVSRATVTQHTKLLELPADIRNKVHKGDISAQSAFDLLSVEETKREEVLAQAEQLAAEEEAAKPAKKATAKDGKGGKAEAPAKPEKAKVTSKHIVEAARQTEALNTVKPRTRNEILGFFQQIIDSTDPYAEPVVAFATALVNKWATGQVGDRSLLNKFDALVEACGQGKTKSKKS